MGILWARIPAAGYNFSKMLTRPKEIRFEATRHCNCQCFFCHNKNTFAKDGRQGKNDLDTSQSKLIIDKVANEGIKQIRFTGGEPLMRKDIFELIRHAKSRGLQVRINTNGTLVDSEVAKKLASDVDMVLISLPTIGEKENDIQTGFPGGFARKLRAIQLLKNRKKDFLWACTVATKKNINELEKVADQAYNLGVDYWFCLRQIPTPQNKITYVGDDCAQLIEKLTAIKDKFADKYGDGEVLNNPFPFCAIGDEEKAAVVCSGAFYGEGHSTLIIDPEGNILADYAYGEIMGNVFNDSIIETWNSANVRKFREYGLLPIECKQCKWLDKCKGGSRVASYIVSGDLAGKDPLMRH